MSSGSFKHQHGAVLIFSLLMLLLLTLVGVSMIEQNKTQLAITSNAGEQMITFSRAETALNMAEALVEATRYQDPVAKTTCKSTNLLYEGSALTLLGSTGTTATVQETYCVIDSHEYRCVGESSYTAKNPHSPENTVACGKLTDAKCPTEVYVLDVTLTDSHGSERTIRSKYAVGCEVPA